MLAHRLGATTAIQELTAEDFYLPAHIVLFGVLVKLALRGPGREIDPLEVKSELECSGLWQRVGGLDVIDKLMDETPTAFNVEGYCKLVRNQAEARATLRAAVLAAKVAQTGDGKKAREILAEAQGRTRPDVEIARASEVRREIEEEISGVRQVVPFVGWPCLTSTLLTMPSTIAVLVGRGGAAKSYFCVEAAWRWLEAGINAAILCFESGGHFHLRRAAAQYSRWSQLTNPMRVARAEGEARAALAAAEDQQARLEASGTIQFMRKPTPTAVAGWVSHNIHRRVLIIDPVSGLDLDESHGHIGQAQRKLLSLIRQAASSAETTVILVNHAASNQAGKHQFGQQRGSSVLEDHTDCVVELEKHAPCRHRIITADEGRVEEMCNRTLHVTKSRNSGAAGKSIGFWFNESFCYIERGWLE
jgi:hypothetical protein